MRATTLISFLVALFLAGLAVFGTRTWLAEQQERLIAAATGAQDERPRDSIVIARVPLRFGERLTAEKLELIEWPSDRLPPNTFTTIEAVTGATEETARYVLESMDAGEPVLSTRTTEPGQRAKLSTAITPGLKAASISVNDVLGVAGFVLPGDRVDVLLTRTTDDRGAFVDVLLQGVRVLAIDQIADDRKDQPSVVRTVTFEVTTEEAQKLTLGATVGTLSLALRNVVSTEIEQIERVTVSDINEGSTAETLAAQQAAAEAAAATAAELATRDAQLAEQAARLAALEAQLRDQGTEPVAPSEPVVVERVVERIVEVVVPPPQPEFVTVGVVRNGQRAEYRVGTNEAAAPQ